jgi:hypothetical protein
MVDGLADFDGVIGCKAPCMSVRPEAEALARAGRLPAEDAAVEDVQAAQRLLESVASPVTDDEARILVALFGPDDCYGLAWTLLHLIETAPNALAADYSAESENAWVHLLIRRQQQAGR